MTKLDEMWDALAKYQSIADDDRYGDTWSDMCRLRTVKACRAAEYAAAAAAKYAAAAAAKYAVAKYAAAKYAAANAAANAAAANAAAAAASGTATEVEYWTQEAIKRINQATGETE